MWEELKTAALWIAGVTGLNLAGAAHLVIQISASRSRDMVPAGNA